MFHKGTDKLETNRLILRRVTMDDAKPMFDNWASNPNVTKFMTWPTHSDVEITKMVIIVKEVFPAIYNVGRSQPYRIYCLKNTVWNVSFMSPITPQYIW